MGIFCSQSKPSFRAATRVASVTLFILTLVLQFVFQGDAAADAIDRKERKTVKWIKHLVRANDWNATEIIINYPSFENADLQKYVIAGLITEINQKKEKVNPAIIDALGHVHYECNACEDCKEPKCDSSQAEPDLLYILEHSPKKVQLLTLQTLGDIGPSSGSLSSLILIVNGDDSELRCAGFRALSRLQGVNYVPAMEGILKVISDESGCEVTEVIKIVSVMGPSAAAAIDPLISLFVRRSNYDRDIGKAIERIGAEAIQRFAKLLRHEEPLALRAIYVLKWMNDPIANEHLAEAYPAVSARNKEVILEVLAYHHPGHEKRGELLKELYKSPDLKEQFASISGLISYSLATKELANEIFLALSSDSESLRLYTIETLEKYAHGTIERKKDADSDFMWRGSGDAALANLNSVVLLPIRESLNRALNRDPSEKVREKVKAVLALSTEIEGMLSFRGKVRERIQWLIESITGERPNRRMRIAE